MEIYKLGSFLFLVLSNIVLLFYLLKSKPWLISFYRELAHHESERLRQSQMQYIRDWAYLQGIKTVPDHTLIQSVKNKIKEIESSDKKDSI